MTSPRSDDLRATPKAVRALGLFGLVIAIVNITPRIANFSGDAIIHLAIAEQAAKGAFFHFNADQISSGSSSLGWTLFEAALLRTLGLGATLVFVKVTCLASFVGATWLVSSIARRGDAPAWAGLAAAGAFLAVAGVSYNATLGMENVAFACVMLGVVDRWEQGGWTLPLLAALLVMLRLEGVLVLGALALGAARQRDLRVAHGAAAIAGCVTCAAIFGAHVVFTGHPLAQASVARAMDARRSAESLHVGPLFLYGQLTLRLVAYGGLTWLALHGARAKRHPTAYVVAAGVVFYTFVVGSSQVARQATWVFAGLAVLAALGVARAYASGRPRTANLAIAALVLVGGAETALRFFTPSQREGGPSASAILAQASARRATTNHLLTRICGGGCCDDEVPGVAIIEVQRRFALDDRVRVVSLDGRTSPPAPDPDALRFDDVGCADLDQVIESEGVVAVLVRPALGGRCPSSEMARRWPAPRIGSFRFDARLPGYVRSCRE